MALDRRNGNLQVEKFHSVEYPVGGGVQSDEMMVQGLYPEVGDHDHGVDCQEAAEKQTAALFLLHQYFL